MADIVNPAKRSEVMAQVRSSGNKSTELRLIGLMRRAGIRGWRRSYPLLGKPDFVFPKLRLVVFVDGCFWHGCSRCYRRPHSHRDYWDVKVQGNRKRDARVRRGLRRSGWHVMRIWEHELKDEPKLVSRLARMIAGLNQDRRASLSPPASPTA